MSSWYFHDGSECFFCSDEELPDDGNLVCLGDATDETLEDLQSLIPRGSWMEDVFTQQLVTGELKHLKRRKTHMATYPALTSAVPDYILKNAARGAAFLEDALDGIGGGIALPSIRPKSTRFIFKRPDQDDVMHDGLELQLFVLRAKRAITKKFYLTKFVEGQEPVAPDCFSLDGIKPDPSCSAKQCESCAGCEKNVFGSGTNADGEPGKGKACADTKELAVFVNKRGIFQLAIMPSALKNWTTYCKDLGAHGRSPADVITVVGFDPAKSYPCYTFTYGGDIPNAAAHEKLIAMGETDEVKQIIERAGVPALPAPKTGEQKALTAGDDEVAAARAAKEKAEKEKAEKAAKEKAEKEKAAKEKAEKEKAAKEKAEKEKAEKEAAANSAAAGSDDLDILGGGDPAPSAAAGAALNSDTQSVIDALGLDLDI